MNTTTTTTAATGDRRKNPVQRESFLRYMMQNHFYFDKQYSHDLSIYRAKDYTCSQFLSSIHSGTITEDGIEYDIIYANTRTTKLRKFLHVNTKRVRVSFRVARNHYIHNTIRPVALVKLFHDIST